MFFTVPYRFFARCGATGRLPMTLLSLAALASAGNRAEAALIRLREQAEVTSSVVRLGDVADIHDANPEMVRRLSAVTIVPAPPTGRSLPIEFDVIRERLLAQGFALTEHEFSGASRVRVGGPKAVSPVVNSAPLTMLAPNELAHRRAEEATARAVAEYVRARAPDLGSVGVSLKLSVEQATLVTAAGSTRLEISGGSAPWTDEQSLQVALVDRQGRRHVLDVACSARQLPRILVPKANVSRGHILRADDVIWKQLEPAEEAGEYATRLDQVVGQEVKRAFRAAEPLPLADLRGVPLIKRGDIVTVLARNQGVVVRMDAKSRGDGCLGQSVKVVSLDGRRELTVRVTGFHEATIAPVVENEGPASTASGLGLRLMTAER